MRSAEFQRRLVLPAAVMFALGSAACGGGEDDSDGKAAASSPPPAVLELAPRDAVELKQVPPDDEGRQRAWTPTHPQPWVAGKEVQVDSRNTKPVGGPVGIYAIPRQEPEAKLGEVQDGEEYPAVCYTDQQDGAQFIRNDSLDGSYVWLRLDADRNGQGDAYIPVANAGFTGLDAQAAPDGVVPRC